MKNRTPLSAKILSLALWNLLLLGVTLVGLAGIQLQNLSSLLLAPTRDRVLADARLLALELTQTPESARDQLLEKHTRARGVTYHLYSSRRASTLWDSASHAAAYRSRSRGPELPR